jgi:hypothetical protein
VVALPQTPHPPLGHHPKQPPHALSNLFCLSPPFTPTPRPPTPHTLLNPKPQPPTHQERFNQLERLRSSVDAERRRADKVFRRAEERLSEAYGLRPAHRGAGGGGGGYDYEDDYEYDFGGSVGGGARMGEPERVRVLEDYERTALHEERRLQGGLRAVSVGLGFGWMLLTPTHALTLLPTPRKKPRSLHRELPRAGAAGGGAAVGPGARRRLAGELLRRRHAGRQRGGAGGVEGRGVDLRGVRSVSCGAALNPDFDVCNSNC